MTNPYVEDFFTQLIISLKKTGYVTGVVTKINADNTCEVDPADESATLPDVLLAQSTSGYVITPKIGSSVIVNTSGLPYICTYGEITSVVIENLTSKLTIDDAVTIRSNGNQIKIDASGITVNDGINGGVINVDQLLIKLNQLEVFQNVIQAQYANLLTQLSTIYLPPLAATVATLVIPPTPFTPTTSPEITDPKFTH